MKTITLTEEQPVQSWVVNPDKPTKKIHNKSDRPIHIQARAGDEITLDVVIPPGETLELDWIEETNAGT